MSVQGKEGGLSKLNALDEVVVPHFSNPFFYSGPTHKTFFGIYTFSYFSDNPIFKRKIPNYSRKTDFTLKGADVIFKSYRPFYIRHAFKKSIGYIFNSCICMKELYERFFCYLLSCYEIKNTLEIK